MEKTTSFDSGTQIAERPSTLTNLTIGAASASVVLFALLHILKPEYDPSWRLASEYAIGDYGWLMRLVFFALVLGCACLFFMLRTQTRSIPGKIGLGFLLATCLGMTMAGLFAIDPITSTPDQATTHGSLHGLASMIGVPGFPIAAILISLSLGRVPSLASYRTPLVLSALLIWISLVWMIATLAVMLPQNGGFGPAVTIGWPNRLMILAYNAWLITAALAAEKLRKQKG